MIPKRFELIDASDIDLLIGNVQEGRSIEYKRDLPGGTDADRKEFLADVSSFANTVGGDVVFGLDEVGGFPSAIVGVSAPDMDAELRKLDSVIESGIDPRIRHSTKAVRCSNGATAIVIRVDRSWVGPHRVTLKGHDKFYARNSAGKYPLDVDELRQAFLQSETAIERLRVFRAERVIEIGRDQTPVELAAGAKLVLHLVPHDAVSSSRLIDIVRYVNSPNLLPPMGRQGWGHRITLEGLLTYTTGAGAPYYTHLYRTGIIEAVNAYVLNRQYDGRWIVPSTAFEEEVIGAVGKYLKILKDLGTMPPVYVFLSLLGVRGRWMGGSASFGDAGYAIDRDLIQLPETVVTDLAQSPDLLMRGQIDAVWNACGFVGSPNFDDDGRWHRRT